jgi:hypothetical protein
MITHTWVSHTALIKHTLNNIEPAGHSHTALIKYTLNNIESAGQVDFPG